MFKAFETNDFLSGGSASWNSLNLRTKKSPLSGEIISYSKINRIELATEDKVRRFGRNTAAITTGIMFGVIPGLIVGAAIGKRKEVTFIGTLNDGRQFLAKADKKTYLKLQKASLNK